MKSRVLVVDDEESIRFTFETFLSDEGYSIVTAGSFDEAEEHIVKTDFDVIFLDIILGDRSGVDVLKIVKEIKPHCPVVMITGYPNVETAADAVRIGAFDYIPKPVRQETLLHVTRIAVQHKLLQEENEKFRLNLEAIFNSVKDGIITVDRDLNVLEVNEAVYTICGIDRNAIGRPFHSVLTSCSETCLHALQKTVESKNPVEVIRSECRHNKNPRQIVTINSTPLINREKTYSGAVVVIRDLTRIDDLERNLRDRRQFNNLIGQNKRMQKIYSLIEDLADVQTTVLITGESGTGKELVAEAIHYRGLRSDKPLVKVNCSALSESLLESELFGHVKGAFTGADKDKTGRFQMAEGGTIFLDEIGDISPRMQLRLLRVLQEKTFERVGDSSPIKADVRIIAATNQNLTGKVQLGEFREDLYYRLKVVEIALPPLRERMDDLPMLADHFLKTLNKKFNKSIESISDDVHRVFISYTWPGNIRELEHTLEHAFVICRGKTITIDHLPDNFAGTMAKVSTLSPDENALDAKTVLQALKKAGWNKSKAARLLGVNVRTIYRKINKFNIKEENTAKP
jgi:PAS domain S-box-containing protein